MAGLKSYDPNKIEAKWRESWEKEGVYKTGERDDGVSDRGEYVLGMFPYPSGDGLHVGHVRVFTAVDVMARYFRMKGKKVLMPMGWDAFGLPAENAAIKKKTNPMKLVPEYEANFKKQFEMVGESYDWEKSFSTTDPDYYKWTQWLFLQLYSIKNKKGERLVYRKEVPINWCPFCKTGLANEEVLPDGTHERCGTKVEQRLMPQWVMRITDYSDRLLDDLTQFEWVDSEGMQHQGLDWPKGILEMQKNWIGRSEGIEIEYEIVGTEKTVRCFTTTPVNFGATFIVIAPEHQLVKELDFLPEYKNGVKEYVEVALRKTELQRQEEVDSKTGVFTGFYARNQVTGEEIPIWISDFVLGHVGTGAVQGCPGHDLRDFQFAKKFGLPIRRVVVGEDGDESEIESEDEVIEKGARGKMVNSDFLNGLEFAEAMQKTMDYFEEKGWGKRKVTYHLRDWVFSRQRYWGEPFPVVYCDKCGDENGVVGVSEEQLPVELPYLESYEPTGTGESPLARATDWVNTTCPVCGGAARRETDTMPNWAGSCWYFLAFPVWSELQGSDPSKESWEKARREMDKWLPVGWYLGGAEHAVLHLLYARFWVKAFNDLGLIDFNEPFARLRDRGTVLADDGRKMSKSWGNVVNPDDIVKRYGADSLRIYEMFMGPWGQAIAWDTRSLIGCYRFVEKIWKLAADNVGEATSKELEGKLNRLITKVEADILKQKFNTCVAAMMEFANAWAGGRLNQEDLVRFVKILAPFAPFVAEEIYQRIETGEKKAGFRSVHLADWPKAEEVKDEKIVMVVQVKGKVRGTLTMTAKDAGVEEVVVDMAKNDSKVSKWLTGGEKVIFVPGRIVSFV